MTRGWRVASRVVRLSDSSIDLTETGSSLYMDTTISNRVGGTNAVSKDVGRLGASEVIAE